jgi:hypothetical protein
VGTFITALRKHAVVKHHGKTRRWKLAELVPVNDALTVRLRGGARLNRDWSKVASEHDTTTPNHNHPHPRRRVRPRKARR